MFNRPIYSSLTADQIQAAMQTVADTFGLPWLTASGNNALQRLWARGDHTSTLELSALATSISTIRPIDAGWLKGQVKLAKLPNAGVARGALFEIFALGMLQAPTQQIAPARLNQAGYDGLLTGSDGKQLRVSIKHYGGSRHLREFEENAKSVEQQLHALLKKSGYPPCQVLLDFPDKYPSETEWKLLRDNLPGWFEKHRFDASPVLAYLEPIDPMQPTAAGNSRCLFSLMLGRFQPPQLLDFHVAFTSYTFIASSDYHPNEIINFYSKLDEGCANLSKHEAVETPDIANVLFVHLPDTVTLAQAEQWVQTYFEERPDKPISGVFLYQPLVVQNQKNHSQLTNGFKICIKTEGVLATHFKMPYIISPPVGSVSIESPRLTLMADRGTGQAEVVTLSDRYVYQQGHHYHRMAASDGGGLTGHISSHFGVHSHSVLDTQQMSTVMGIKSGPERQLLTMQQRHPQIDTLLIV